MRSRIVLRDHPDNPGQDSLAWEWLGGEPVAFLDFGAPSAVTDLTLCIYDQSGLKLSATAPAGGSCGPRSCWSSSSTRLKYSDVERTPAGISALRLRSGELGKARISLRAKGSDLKVPTLGLEEPVTVRLIRSDGTPCWQAEYPSSNANDERQFKAKIVN
jgi:hypothetical protein